MSDEVGADGVTVREAIASRTLLSVNKIIEAYNHKEVDFPGARLAVVALIEANLPFVDPTTKEILHQLSKVWDDMQKEWEAAGAQLAIAEGTLPTEFGAWGAGK